ncbi:hypothetical protein GCM10027598_58470 [Amycolatopsis oliviviridis]|uniref:WXG100 family type VII secretion target n=1 Tax=Amycolatopsis oliviviridis TaxID=1471590 RepID=A0ABQ3LX54_9PSEU|nr:hypothetical protein [Amycolatopsis oliviviridis]GHH28369.1 hypothetical protein GCM10017790_59110 [Amycolatopsis oliviviridis]
MSNTQLNSNDINAQARAHDETADNISGQLDQLRSQIEMTLAASNSAATKALSTTCTNWVESMRKSTIEHLRTMAQNMRAEAGHGEATDADNMQRILSIPMETGNFLGAS